ncbi:hypothetical protein BGZ51_003697 [Haplosporangium sp. Z 767]|nr:hypothetical protein BGZ51_003697 [Haplosporangium sp. Z 767]
MRTSLIALFFLLWLLSGDDGPRTDHLQKTLQTLQEEAAFCGNRTFGTNLTYSLPKSVSIELTKLYQTGSRDPRAHYYHNVTGSFKGEWTFDEDIATKVNEELPLPPRPTGQSNSTKNETHTDTLTAGSDSGQSGTREQNSESGNGSTTNGGTNSTTEEVQEEQPLDTIEDKKAVYLEDVAELRGSFQFNKSGSFTFNLKESKATEYVNWVKGTWRLRHDDNEDFGIALNIQGIHFVHSGSFYMWGIPEETRMPIWRLLDLMPNNASFALAAAALKDQYQQRINTIERVISGSERLEYPESTLSEPSSCHYQMYMQLGAVSPHVRSTLLKDLEKEWAAPQGISTIKAPHLNSTLFLYSPNCRLALGVKKAEGMKREKFYAKAVNYAGMAGTLAFFQVFLLVRQMEYTPTPSSVSKVSYWTIAIQVFIDSYLCMLHLTTGVLVASFFSFVLVAIFGMRYMLVIWRIQRPERRGRRNRAAAAAAAAAAATAAAANNNNNAGTTTAIVDGSSTVGATNTQRPADTMPGGLPLPVTTPRTTTSDDADSPRADMQALYGRFYWMLIVSLITLYRIVISSTRVQNLMISACALCLFSFWIPQIVRNVTRGSKRGLSVWFILGMSVTRLTLPVYFYACPENLMGHEPTPWIWGLVVWVALQVGVLLLQDWLGPRFFVPKKYLPPIYDYHPILPVADEEFGRNAHGRHGPQQDCAICMLPIDTAPQMAGAARLSSVVGSLGRLNYMLTPCGHLFHSDCLERWMRIKLECPNCRAFLPST